MNFQKLHNHLIHQINGKSFQIFWSKAADQALNKRQQPLIVEMELKFACMVRMHVYFHDTLDNANAITINDKIQVLYRPIIGQSCDITDRRSQVVMGDISSGPMAERFPKKLGIDYKRGQWIGKFS